MWDALKTEGLFGMDVNEMNKGWRGQMRDSSTPPELQKFEWGKRTVSEARLHLQLYYYLPRYV